MRSKRLATAGVNYFLNMLPAVSPNVSSLHPRRKYLCPNLEAFNITKHLLCVKLSASCQEYKDKNLPHSGKTLTHRGWDSFRWRGKRITKHDGPTIWRGRSQTRLPAPVPKDTFHSPVPSQFLCGMIRLGAWNSLRNSGSGSTYTRFPVTLSSCLVPTYYKHLWQLCSLLLKLKVMNKWNFAIENLTMSLSLLSTPLVFISSHTQDSV